MEVKLETGRRAEEVLEGVVGMRIRTRLMEERKKTGDQRNVNDFISNFNVNTNSRKTTLVDSIVVVNSKSQVQPSFISNSVPLPTHLSFLTSSFTQPSQHPPNLPSHTSTLEPPSSELPNSNPNPNPKLLKLLKLQPKRSTTLGPSSTSGSLATQRLNLERQERR